MRGKTVERRFGWDCHGLPAELHSEQELKLLRPPRHREIRRRPLQRALPHVGDAVPQGLGVLRQPFGALGRLRQRLPHDGPHLHGIDHVGVQTALGQRARLRRLPRRALFVGGADAALQFRDAPRRFLPHAPGPGADRRLPARSETRRTGNAPSRVDDDAVDAAVQHGPRRQARRRLRGAREGRRAPHLRRGLARALRGRTRRLQTCRHSEGQRSRRPNLRAALPVLRRPQAGRGVPRRPRRFHRDGRGHRRRPHGARLRRGRPCRLAERGPAARRSGRPRGQLHRADAALSGQERLRRQQGHHPRSQGAGGRRHPPRDLRPQLSALLAHRSAADLQGDAVLVRAGHRNSATAWSSSTRTSTGCRRT